MQGACVQNVLDSVVESLQRDPNRKFVFAEMVIKSLMLLNWFLLLAKFIDPLIGKFSDEVACINEF